MEWANLLTPLFILIPLAAMIWKHIAVRIVCLILIYAGFIYYALNFIPEL